LSSYKIVILSEKGKWLKMNRINDRKRSLLRMVDVLKREGPMTQTMLKEHTNMQASTASYLMNDLKSIGIVINSGETIQGSGAGKPGNLIQLNNNLAQFIGIYVEDNQVNVYVTGLDGITLDYRKVVMGNPTQVEQALIQVVDSICQENSIIRGIGIAMKAMVLSDGTIRFGYRDGMNENWKLQGLLQRLTTHFSGIPIVIENDANCTALLYQYEQKEDKMDLVLYLLNRIPFGIGCSILVKGKLLKGANGSTGQYFEKGSRLRSLAIDKTNKDEYLESFITALMPHIATTAYLLDPKIVVLSGSFLSDLEEKTVDKVESIIKSYHLPIEVILTKGNQDYDPAKGAALIAMNDYISSFIAKVGAR